MSTITHALDKLWKEGFERGDRDTDEVPFSLSQFRKFEDTIRPIGCNHDEGWVTVDTAGEAMCSVCGTRGTLTPEGLRV